MRDFWSQRLCHSLTLGLMFSPTAQAQACDSLCTDPSALLGASEQKLVASVLDIQRAPKPELGPRNSRGKWVLSHATIESLPYTVTFFMKSGTVYRIEYLSKSSMALCRQRIPFQDAVNAMRLRYDAEPVVGEFNANGRAMVSSTFSANSIDASVQLSMSSEE